MNQRDSKEIAAERQEAFSRRRFLRGLGACVALPALESLMPPRAHAARALAASAQGAPVRTAFIYVPNGALQRNWWPKGEGKSFAFNKTMGPLHELQDRIQVIGGLDHVNATAGPDGAGDHARANATFLTGMRARKTDGANIHVGVSIDQVAAKHIGHLTRFPSLELSCDAVRKSGRCDSGYSCAYQYNLSWRAPTTPMAPEPNPRLVFERLFGGGEGEDQRKNHRRRKRQQNSLLDFVMADAASLHRTLGREDQSKLDEYLGSVREVERRIEHAESFGPPPRPNAPAPEGVPEEYGAYIDVMFDMLALAFQTDSTRVATLLLAHDGSNRDFPQIGIPEGHHFLTHHLREADKSEKVGKIDVFYMNAFARFLNKLENMHDPGGDSVLHNSMIVYGGGIADANRHTHHNLPLILAGNGGGRLDAGRYHNAGNVPMSNLFLGMLGKLGIEGVDSFGDSDGRFDAI